MTAPVTVYVPCDSAALSMGADLVAAELESAALAAGRPIHLVRNGSRGMLWLEPLVEVVTERGRIGYGPVEPDQVGDLVAAGMLDGANHALCQGVVDDLPWLRDQTRLCFARTGIIDPLSPEDYLAHGGLAGLRRALRLAPVDAGGAAPGSRPGSSGGPSPTPPAGKNSCAVTPTRATAGRSPTGC
jgi:formate dehydrogenase iron-sulfur subunit